MKNIALYIFAVCCIKLSEQYCKIPFAIQGAWFSREAGVNTVTEFDSTSMISKGHKCIIMHQDPSNIDVFTFVFQADTCYYCLRIITRTFNVLEKTSTRCVTLAYNEVPTFEKVCGSLDATQQPVTMFSENPTPANCRESLEGVWQFAYQRRDMFTGECNNYEANITSCQEPGTQFLILNQQFTINYKKCPGMDNTFNADVYYTCLGSWFVGNNHYFAAVNSKESRKEEKYRCFLRNRIDDIYLGVSITADCNVLKTPQESPERLRLTPVKAEEVQPGCNLPQNFTGRWINTANADAQVTINATHIVETWRPDQHRSRTHVYVCQQQRDTRYMMARLAVDGCQKDFICYEFLPRHHNIIRYRKGTAMFKGEFPTVCSWVMFSNKQEWSYSLLILENPMPIRCPIAGKFNFTQKGTIPFETRIRGGITQSPYPNVYCREIISDFSVCDSDQRQIKIDANYCLSVDYRGLPLDIYTQPDYVMNCIGFWKENLKSYLITMDEEDAFTRFRCWVYQRADLNRVLLSYGVGAFCELNQQVTSYNSTEGALVALEMTEYERERDNCPMYFDDGANPWRARDEIINVFTFNMNSALTYNVCSTFIFVTFLTVLIGRLCV